MNAHASMIMLNVAFLTVQPFVLRTSDPPYITPMEDVHVRCE